VLEEILYALDAKKPVFIIGVGRGAAGLFAGWLASPPTNRPSELTINHYLQDANFRAVHNEIAKLPAGTTETADTAFDRLWGYVNSARYSACLSTLLNNGLDEKDNKSLFTTDS
jgi:hypothetical protein